MLELIKKKLEIKYEGKDYSLRFPTYKESITYSKKLKENDSIEHQADALLDYLAGLGLPKEVSENLESEHIVQILDLINDSKKK